MVGGKNQDRSLVRLPETATQGDPASIGQLRPDDDQVWVVLLYFRQHGMGSREHPGVEAELVEEVPKPSGQVDVSLGNQDVALAGVRPGGSVIVVGVGCGQLHQQARGCCLVAAAPALMDAENGDTQTPP